MGVAQMGDSKSFNFLTIVSKRGERSMKRLFVVTHITSAYRSVEFADKMEAKAHRDSLGGIEEGLCVSRGPDHMGKHGCRGVPHKHAEARRS